MQNEKLKIEKQNDDINIYKPNQLKRIFTSSYYKDIRVLKIEKFFIISLLLQQ